MPYNFPKKEEEILKFWRENRIFEKLTKKNKGKKRWSFLDGPITANNPMGVHHAWGRTYKDLFQRYKAMQGFDERYQNGFDCQGLWVEVEVEKELGFKNKKDIEIYGIDKFVEKCKERVKKYSAIQTQQSIRLGQWMDWDNSYYTMSDENNYAIWNFLKKCWQDGYLYKGRDSVPWCPRCGTAISQHEILTEEYKEIIHKAIYFKLPIIEGKLKGAKFLVWTTTPWTIPANVALVVNPDFEYGIYKKGNEELILLVSLAEKILDKNYKLEKKIKGKDLKGIKYEGPFDDLPRVKKIAAEKPETFHAVVLDKELVTEIEGTGIVHTAPGAGEEDFKIGQKEGLAVIDVIDEAANYLDGMEELSTKNAKKNPELIFSYLGGKWIFKLEDYQHRYPTCWRCKTELVWRVVDEWYISMEKLRKPLMEITKKINWIPDFGKERELDWLKNMHDWLISKKRYWGLALPIFECQKCGNFEVIGSKEELKKRAVGVPSGSWDKFEGHSPHRPWVDNVKIKCKKCGEIVSRIKDVGNPWLDAGIVSFSTMKYFENKTYWKKWFPAELVCESFPGQFKNWFYSLLVMSAVLEKTNPMKTIFGYASVKDEKGEEMHKSKGNAIWFDEAVEKIGADTMRWLYSKQNPAENFNFGYNVAKETKRKLMTLYNSYVFFNTYVKKEELPAFAEASAFSKLSADKSAGKSENVLDRWIVSRVNGLMDFVESNLDKYNAAKAVLRVEDFFINDLSLWFIRRSRVRFREDNPERNEAVATLYYALSNLIKILAPATPFFAEEMYQTLRLNNMPESIHLCDWPRVNKKLIDKKLEEKMDEVRTIVSLALAERMAKGIKVKQPLASLKIQDTRYKIQKDEELLRLAKEEINVKEIIFDDEIKNEVELDTEISQELMQEGQVREIIRHLQGARKILGLTPQDRILIYFSGEEILNKTIESSKGLILSQAQAKEIFIGGREKTDFDFEKEILIDGKKILFAIKKL